MIGILKEAEAGVPIPDLRRPSREPCHGSPNNPQVWSLKERLKFF